MNYLGSKAKIAKEILPLILANRKDDNELYIEPFAGGFNSISRVTGNRLAYDINPVVISLFQYLKETDLDELENTLPSIVTKEDYLKVREDYKKGIINYLTAFVLIGCSFGDKFNAGYAKNARGYNYALRTKTNLLKQKATLGSIDIRLGSYVEINLDIPKAIIYCDPPYKDTTKYKVADFNYEAFYAWCRLANSKGHEIFLSEYQAPSDFKELWSKEVPHNLRADSNKQTRVEKLFKL